MLRIGAAVGCFGSMMLVAGCLTVAQGIGNSGSFWPGAFASNFGRFSSLAGISTLAADALGRDRLSDRPYCCGYSEVLNSTGNPAPVACHTATVTGTPAGPGHCVVHTVHGAGAFARGVRSAQ